MKLLQPLLLMSLIVVASGCQTMRMTNGVPNLAQVNPGLWRGGQPTEQGWVWLRSNGVTNVVKLNTESEGSDAFAESLGMAIYRCPITFKQQMGLGSIWQFETRNDACYALHPGTFIHCSHGQDRTGLVVATYRVLVDDWTKAAAEKEMLDHGFHKELIGLWEYWKAFDPVSEGAWTPNNKP